MPWLQLQGKDVTVIVDDALRLTAIAPDGKPLWQSSNKLPPTIVVRKHGEDQMVRFSLSAKDAPTAYWEDRPYVGKTVILERFGADPKNTNVSLAVRYGIHAAENEACIEVEQVGGTDVVARVEHFYRFDKRVSEGGYLILPHGSGYLIPADCPDALPGEGYDGGLVGARWSLPFFGMAKRDQGLSVTVDSWWDCNVRGEHIPGDASAIDLFWLGSLGTLSYPRRFLLRFEPGMDYVRMAKRYRDRARREGLLRTLEERVADGTQLESDSRQVFLNWPEWKADQAPEVLRQVKALHEAGHRVRFGFPKWHATTPTLKDGKNKTPDAGWQAYLRDNPVNEGWPAVVKLAESLSKLGCSLQYPVNMRVQYEDAPEYDDGRWPHDKDGVTVHDLSAHDALKRLGAVLDRAATQRARMDELVFEGYSAFQPLREDYSVGHVVTRREAVELQCACFAEARRRRIRPAGELARFWAVADCDIFRFSDWASDRLSNAPSHHATRPVGVPIPLFQLVFHDCLMAGFAGGGYASLTTGLDWWPDRTPRLYELLFAAAPSYNWLPRVNAARDTRRLQWLRRWAQFYRRIVAAEMTSHAFLADDRTIHRITFANGAAAELDMANNRFRVTGVTGFDGTWETPPDLSA